MDNEVSPSPFEQQFFEQLELENELNREESLSLEEQQRLIFGLLEANASNSKVKVKDHFAGIFRDEHKRDFSFVLFNFNRHAMA